MYMLTSVLPNLIYFCVASKAVLQQPCQLKISIRNILHTRGCQCYNHLHYYTFAIDSISTGKIKAMYTLIKNYQCNNHF